MNQALRIRNYKIVGNNIILKLSDGSFTESEVTLTPKALVEQFQLRLIYVVTVEPTGKDDDASDAYHTAEWKETYREADQRYVSRVRDLQRVHAPNLISLWACLVPVVLLPKEITEYVRDGFLINNPGTAVPLARKITETVTEPAHIIIQGNPVDGFTFIGPYATGPAAIEAGEQLDGEWWTAPLERPEEN